MATTTEARERAESYLRFAEAIVEDLPEVAEEWDGLGVDGQMSFSLEWSNEMSGLARLSEYSSRGQLTGKQQERYAKLRGKLKEIFPLVEKLDLYRPPIKL